MSLPCNDVGRLWRLYIGDALVAEYIYNAQGQQSRKVVHEGTEQTVIIYHYGLEGELLTETDATGKTIRDYVWGNGQGAVQIEVSSVTEKLVYLYPDHLMTSRLATDSTGTIVWSWEGDVFGGTESDNDPDNDGQEWNVQLRFPGQYLDAESGLHYNWNRFIERMSCARVFVGSKIESAFA